MAGLETYRAKRDFKATAEPRGRIGPRRAKALRFVIQRHDATRLHYDFRLELDGVYKSWAVTKVPSLDPATRRLAVEVEDHPLDYGTFEGIIPEGQYGGGTVQLWDEGHWAPRGDAHKGLAEGHMKFDLDGKRMHGGWALVRMPDRDARPGRKVRHNWLLIKEKSDEYARAGEPDALLAEDTSVKTGRTLEEIAGNPRKRVWHSDRKSAAKSAPSGKPKLTGARPAAASVKKKTMKRRKT